MLLKAFFPFIQTSIVGSLPGLSQSVELLKTTREGTTKGPSRRVKRLLPRRTG
jgi:hypothetical protein